MYVTKPLSRYYNLPDAVLEPPPEGPHSGILVIEDEEAEAQSRRFFGLLKNSMMSSLPFPQNRNIQVQYRTGTADNRSTDRDDVFFIPVIGQPLSNNRYYIVRAQRKYKGKACVCSKEEDVSIFCICRCVNDCKPSSFDYRDIYQQFEIILRRKGRFQAKSVAFDGFPPTFLRRKGWEARTSVPTNYLLGEALGLNASLRGQMPNLNFPITSKYSSSLVVGKWYIPYIFIEEEDETPKDQMKRSMFYVMTLEQFWENICASEKSYGTDQGNVVEVGVSVLREMVLLNGNEVVNRDTVNDGGVRFKPVNSNMGQGLGLSLPIWERMKWEEERGGWVCGNDKVERVERMELYEGDGGWRKFGCFVLVERFVLRRMDGSLALTYDFKHTNKVRIRWE